MESVTITTPYITLDGFLKFSGWVDSGAHAKILIQEGKVDVNGEVEVRRGRKLYDGDVVCYEGHAAKVAHLP